MKVELGQGKHKLEIKENVVAKCLNPGTPY
jgi:hypothetical protein